MLTVFEVEEVEDVPHEGRLHELLELHLARVLLRERTLEHRLEVERVLKVKSCAVGYKSIKIQCTGPKRNLLH